MRGSSISQQAGGYMYAVVKTGGKQYRVSAGEKLKIEQIPAEVGQEITLATLGLSLQSMTDHGAAAS